MTTKWFCTYTVTDCSVANPEPNESETWECDSLRDACRNDIPSTVDGVQVSPSASNPADVRWIDFYATSYEVGMEHRHSIAIPGNATASSRARIVRLLQTGKYC
jgi:hypothetical protein